MLPKQDSMLIMSMEFCCSASHCLAAPCAMSSCVRSRPAVSRPLAVPSKRMHSIVGGGRGGGVMDEFGLEFVRFTYFSLAREK